ncbi:hypothetical protein [Sphingobacterium multivorum]|uniref:hypothetical protein n=1 Tax=Sphingobacterium multivorum TaxID=28454 RepID=UPI0028AA351F|nr:hypothetical protein [Sphingobacterium multivorum]
MSSINIIKGGTAKDHRGQIRFVNDFCMSAVQRFYIIKNADVDLVRGWRAHKIEQRWFYVLNGAFEFDFVKIDNWENPARELPIERRIIRANDMELMHVPAGYGTAFKALEINSELLVYSDYEIAHAVNDDYVYPIDYFFNRVSGV